jgi:hypothetical protein
MPLSYRRRPINSGVGLHPEEDAEGRAVREFAGAERVYWVQCPRCRRRYWYALRYDTGATEVQYFGSRFRQRFAAEGCGDHSLAPLPDPTAPAGGA